MAVDLLEEKIFDANEYYKKIYGDKVYLKKG